MKANRWAAVLLVIGVAAGGCGKGESEAAADETAAVAPIQLTEADLATATVSTVGSGVVLNGSLQPALIVRINAQAPGNITNIRVDRGVRVGAGQALATIAAAGIRGQAEGARAGVAAAEANLAVARQRRESARTLRQAGALSQLDFQAAEAAFKAAEAQVAAANAQAAGAIEAAQRATVTSPIAGVIGNRLVNDGEAVMPGQELFTVVQSGMLELSGQVPVDAAASIREGQPVVFTLEAYPGKEFRGAVARIEPMANPDTRQVGVYMQMRNPGNLIGGQFASGRILGQRVDTAVVIPESAVRTTGAESAVLVVEGNRVVRRPVTLGPINPSTGTIAVLTGVKAGERVIARSSATIQEGATVQIGTPKATTAAQPDGEKK